MTTCCCALAGTRACQSCPNNSWSVPARDWYTMPVMGQRVIEKYQDGKLIERIIENPTLTITTPDIKYHPNVWPAGPTPLTNGSADLSAPKQGDPK